MIPVKEGKERVSKVLPAFGAPIKESIQEEDDSGESSFYNRKETPTGWVGTTGPQADELANFENSLGLPRDA